MNIDVRRRERLGRSLNQPAEEPDQRCRGEDRDRADDCEAERRDWLDPEQAEPFGCQGRVARVEPGGKTSLGRVKLAGGLNPVTITVTGKNPASTNYLVGIDGFELKPL